MAFLLDILDFLRSRCDAEAKNGKYSPKSSNLTRKPLEFRVKRCFFSIFEGQLVYEADGFHKLGENYAKH
jgi:hypothetical protein